MSPSAPASCWAAFWAVALLPGRAEDVSRPAITAGEWESLELAVSDLDRHVRRALPPGRNT